MSAAPQQLPAALRARRASIEAANPQPNPDGTQSPPPAAEPPAVAEPVTPAAAVIDPKMFEVPTDSPPPAPAPAAPQLQLVPPSEDFEQKYRSLQGIIKARDSEIVALKGALQVKTEQAPPAPAAQAPPAPAQFQLPELDEETRKKYAGSLPVIQRVALEIASQLVAPLMQRLQALEGLSDQVTNTQKAVVGLSASTFKSALYTAIPDLAQLSHAPAFKDWIKSPIPYSGGETIQHRLKAAYDSEDAATIVAIVQDYRKQGGSAQPAAADPARFSQPATGSGATPQLEDTSTAKPILAWSKRQEASVKHRKRQMSTSEFNQIEQLYLQAIAEERVDYSK